MGRMVVVVFLFVIFYVYYCVPQNVRKDSVFHGKQDGIEIKEIEILGVFNDILGRRKGRNVFWIIFMYLSQNPFLIGGMITGIIDYQ